MNGIPTAYNGLTFRSRLEATWAAWFDTVGWPYAYEPIELEGYIPDFILRFHEPLLCEIKPGLAAGDLEAAKGKIGRSSWRHGAMVLGVGLAYLTGDGATHPKVGILTDPEVGWGDAVLFTCLRCGKVSVYHDSGCWACRVCGVYDGDGHMGPYTEADFKTAWHRAQELTRWTRKGDAA